MRRTLTGKRLSPSLLITRIYSSHEKKAIRQSDMTLREALEGLSPDDYRLRDEIVRFVGDRAR